MINDYWEKIKNWNEQNKTWFWGGIGGVIITLIITIAITIYSNSGKQKTSPSTIKNNDITVSGSNNNTFKDLKSTSGDVNIITGNGNINKTVNKTTINQGIPHQDYLNLAKDFGITENAVKNFFKIIQQKEVPRKDWDATLRQIATRHKELQTRLKQFNLLVDPEIKELRLKAEEAINNVDYDAADKYFDEALDRQMFCINNAEKQLTNCKLSAAEMKVDKGDLELIRINYKSATKLFKEAVELVPDGDEHKLKKAEYLQKWGYTAYYAGLFFESQTALEQCLSIREKLLPKDDKNVATTLNNLAVTYYSQGKYEEAEALFQRSLGIYEKYFGKDHSNIANTLSNLGGVYMSQGKYEEAESFYQRSLGIRETRLGKDHPDVASSLKDLAWLYKSQGKYEEADHLYQRSLGIYPKALGKKVQPNFKTILQNYIITSEEKKLLKKYLK